MNSPTQQNNQIDKNKKFNPQAQDQKQQQRDFSSQEQNKDLNKSKAREQDVEREGQINEDID